MSVSTTEIKEFVKKSVLFLGFFLVISFFSNLFYANIIMAESIVNRSEKQFESYLKEQQKIETLILGDSHPQRAVDPRYLNNSFNYATKEESYIQTYYKFKHLLNTHGQIVERVLLPLDLHNFSSNRLNQDKNIYYWYKYINPNELCQYQKSSKKCLFDYYLRAHFFSYATNLNNFTSFLKLKDSKSKLINGFNPEESEKRKFEGTEQKSRIAEKRVKQHFYKGRKKVEIIEEASLWYFRKILELCLENDIEIVLVKYPVTKEYWGEATIKSDTVYFDETLLELLNIYPQARILDYRQAFFGQDELFFNSDHLNALGAKKFTQALALNLQ